MNSHNHVGSRIKYSLDAADKPRHVEVYLTWHVEVYLTWHVEVYLTWHVEVYLTWHVEVYLTWHVEIYFSVARRNFGVAAFRD